MQLRFTTITEPRLEDLLRGETLEIEYKEDSGNFSDSKIHESVVALTNTEGGYLLIGVSNNGEVKGSTRLTTGYWKNAESIAGMILANTMPACATAVTIEAVNGKQIVLIRVPKSQSTTGTKRGKFLKRVLDSNGRPENVPMSADDIVRGVSKIGIQDFSTTVLSGSTLTDIDLELVRKAARHRAQQTNDPGQKELLSQPAEPLLSAAGLLSYSDQKPNIACLLLFGKDQIIRDRLPNHEIQYQVFGPRGELLKNIPFTGPIARNFAALLTLPELLRNSDEFRFHGSNVVIPEYPEDSRREAFANAIVHRDYTLPAGIQIQLYEKELIITNPGGFPNGVNLSNLLSVPPTPRNRRLAEAMRIFGFVETSGRGIDYIFEGQARFGRPAPDYSSSSNDRVSVRLAGGKANLDFCKFVLASVPNPTIPELLLLNALFFRRDLTTEEASGVVQKSTQITHEILFKMHQDGLVEISSDKSPKYFLRGSLHHSARKAVKPARLTRIQISKFKEALVAELRRRSPNTVSNLADAVGLSPSQARRLLNQLRIEGQVESIRNKKWAAK